MKEYAIKFNNKFIQEMTEEGMYLQVNDINRASTFPTIANTIRYIENDLHLNLANIDIIEIKIETTITPLAYINGEFKHIKPISLYYYDDYADEDEDIVKLYIAQQVGSYVSEEGLISLQENEIFYIDTLEELKEMIADLETESRVKRKPKRSKRRAAPTRSARKPAPTRTTRTTRSSRARPAAPVPLTYDEISEYILNNIKHGISCMMK